MAVPALLALLTAGCAEKTATTDQASTAAASAPAATPPAPAPDQPAPSEQQPSAQSTAAPAPPAAATAPPSPAAPAAAGFDDFIDEPALKDVLFEPGRADIGRTGARRMKDNAHWILENRDYLVLVEGHTDYKGTHEANLVIGEQRAQAAVKVLLKEGLPETRLRTVSYGSDRPVCAEKTDACAAKNRRVHFRVKKE